MLQTDPARHHWLLKSPEAPPIQSFRLPHPAGGTVVPSRWRWPEHPGGGTQAPSCGCNAASAHTLPWDPWPSGQTWRPSGQWTSPQETWKKSAETPSTRATCRSLNPSPHSSRHPSPASTTPGPGAQSGPSSTGPAEPLARQVAGGSTHRAARHEGVVAPSSRRVLAEPPSLRPALPGCAG